MSKKKPEISIKTVAKSKAYQPLKTKTKLIILAVAMLISFGLYFQSLQFGYVLDDVIVFTENNFVKKGFAGFGDILSNDSFSGYFGEQKDLVQGARYRPLSLLTFAAEYQFFGTNGTISHLINLLLYGLVGFLSFITLRRLFREKVQGKNLLMSTAAITVLIYLCHPIHVEAIANVKGRDEILSLLFSMLSFQLSLKYIDKKKIGYLGLVVLSYFVGLLAKENTITFLAIIPFGILLFRKEAKKKALTILATLFAVTILYLGLRYQIIGYLLGDEPAQDLMNNSFVGMNTGQRYATIMYTLLIYLKLHLIPHPLTHDYYPYHIPIMEFTNWQVWLSMGIHLVLAALTVKWMKTKRHLSFGLLFYFAAMSIVSNLVVSIGTFMNERFAFAASLGLCIILAKLIKELAKKAGDKKHLVTAGMMALILIPFAIKTITRVPVWESALTLNRAAIKVSKNSARANSFMSTALFNAYKEEKDRGRQMQLLNEATPYANKAVEIHPTYFNGHLMSVGIASEKYKLDRDLDALLLQFKNTIRFRPDVTFIKTFLEYINKTEDKNKLLAFYEEVGVTILTDQQQKYQWAINFLNLGMQVDPNDPRIRRGLRKAYTGLGDLQKANQYR